MIDFQVKYVINDYEVMSDNVVQIFNFSLIWTMATLDNGII